MPKHLTDTRTTFGGPTASGPGLGSAVRAPQNASFQLPLPGPNWIGLRTEALWGDGSGGIVAMLDDPSPQVIHGGGFEDVPRPLRRGVPRWRGTATPTLPLALVLIDPTFAGASIEAARRTLMKLAGGMTAHDPEPPRLLLNGEALTSEVTGARQRWVIAEPPEWGTDPGEVLRDPDTMARVKQHVGLVLMLAADDPPVVSAPAAAAPQYRYVSAKRGDTYELIAKRELGEKRLAHRLARLNGATSVDVHLATHKRVKLPTGALLSEWKRDLKRA